MLMLSANFSCFAKRARDTKLRNTVLAAAEKAKVHRTFAADLRVNLRLFTPGEKFSCFVIHIRSPKCARTLLLPCLRTSK